MDINPAAGTLTSLYPAAAVVDARQRIILPGFVNAHFHGESVLLRHITRRTPYALWETLSHLGVARARLLESSSLPDVAALHRIEGFFHLRSGTTSVAEYPAPYTPALLEVAMDQMAASGVRFVLALQTWEQIEAVRSSPPGERQYSIALGPEDGYTTYSLENLLRASTATQIPLAAHLGEVRAEVEALRSRFKKSPLRILKDAGVLLPSSHLIHCNHLPEEDLDIIRQVENTVTLCVRSTVAKQTGYPLLRPLASRDVRICLGTDWGETDLLGEIRVLRNLRKYVPGTPAYSPLELIRMATINGAHALGIGAHAGSLEVGKHADLVMIPLDDLRLPAYGSAPGAEELARIVTDYCDTGMISDVMSRGVFRIRNSEPVRADGRELLREFRRLQELYIPRGEREDERAPGIPLVPASQGEKTPLMGHGETGGEVSREQTANTSPPGTTPDATLQKFPMVTKKIGKVFGEDDV